MQQKVEEFSKWLENNFYDRQNKYKYCVSSGHRKEITELIESNQIKETNMYEIFQRPV